MDVGVEKDGPTLKIGFLNSDVSGFAEATGFWRLFSVTPEALRIRKNSCVFRCPTYSTTIWTCTTWCWYRISPCSCRTPFCRRLPPAVFGDNRLRLRLADVPFAQIPALTANSPLSLSTLFNCQITSIYTVHTYAVDALLLLLKTCLLVDSVALLPRISCQFLTYLVI